MAACRGTLNSFKTQSIEDCRSTFEHNICAAFVHDESFIAMLFKKNHMARIEGDRLPIAACKLNPHYAFSQVPPENPCPMQRCSATSCLRDGKLKRNFLAQTGWRAPKPICLKPFLNLSPAAFIMSGRG